MPNNINHSQEIMNKKKIIASTLAIAVLFAIAMRLPQKAATDSSQQEKKITKVSAKLASDTKTFSQTNKYPASIVGDQEIKITAKSSGTITFAPSNIGDSVRAGSILAKIDDTGNIAVGDQGLKSLQVQQSEIAAKQAKESYELAKDLYDNLKDSSEATNSQKDSAKAQKDIAKLQFENAALGLEGNVDNRLITSPISGVITNKAVSIGDSVSAGQLIASISKSFNVKVRFYVDQTEKEKITRGQEVSAVAANGNAYSLVVRNIASAADPITKRFLIEAYPKNTTDSPLLAGTITTVTIESIATVEKPENLLLPLSAISIGQNESYIFVLENNVAKKILIDVVHVSGELAEVSAAISNQTQIIVDGNKLIRDGETVELKK